MTSNTEPWEQESVELSTKLEVTAPWEALGQE